MQDERRHTTTMDRVAIEGRAAKAVEDCLKGCLVVGMVDEALKHRQAADEIEAIKAEVLAIAALYGRIAEACHAIEFSNRRIDRDTTDKTGEPVQLRIDPESTPHSQVLWGSLGYFIELSTETPAEAVRLYEALQCVTEVVAD